MKRVSQPSAGITTALIYTRVSSDEQAREGVSLDAQLAECRRYAVAHGWMIGDEYQDVMTGKRDDRPLYQRMREDLRRHHAAGRRLVVVVAALDRLGRRLLEQVRCRDEVKALGVAVHSVRDGGEVSDFVANVLASAAQEEVRRLSERIRASNLHLAAGGWHHLGRAPWGYRWRPATHEERGAGAPRSVLEVNEVASPYVREAFDRLARGDSMRSVANWLARLPESARDGRQMRYSGVYVILRLPTYIGQFDDGKPGRWPAIVDEESWHRAREAIARHKHLPKQASRKYLLTGFLRCERCQSRMTGWHQNGRPLRYRCGGNQQGAASPNFRCYYNMRCQQIEQPVLAEVANILELLTTRDQGLRTALQERWQAFGRRSDADDAAATIRRLEQDASKARERLTNAAVLLVDGTIDKAGYERLRDKAQADLEAAETEVARLTGKRAKQPILPPLEIVIAEATGWRRVLSEGKTELRREVLAQLIRTITPRRLMRDTFAADVEWTPLGEMLHVAAHEAAA